MLLVASLSSGEERGVVDGVTDVILAPQRLGLVHGLVAAAVDVVDGEEGEVGVILQLGHLVQPLQAVQVLQGFDPVGHAG